MKLSRWLKQKRDLAIWRKGTLITVIIIKTIMVVRIRKLTRKTLIVLSRLFPRITLRVPLNTHLLIHQIKHKPLYLTKIFKGSEVVPWIIVLQPIRVLEAVQIIMCFMTPEDGYLLFSLETITQILVVNFTTIMFSPIVWFLLITDIFLLFFSLIGMIWSVLGPLIYPFY